MKNTLFLVAASAALASAQATLNQTTGKFTCAKPNVAYCAGDSLKTDIIIRCDSNGVGQPGRCTDNLDGEPPVGLFTSLCWTSSNTAGDAACEKNCVVYGGSGNGNGTFTLPADQCQPTYTATSTISSSTTYSGSLPPTSYPTTTLTTYTSSTTPCPPLSTGSGSSGGSGGNGTVSGSKPTYTPPSPTTGPPTVPTAGATANRVGGALAVLGLVAVFAL